MSRINTLGMALPALMVFAATGGAETNMASVTAPVPPMSELCLTLAHIGVWVTFAALAVWPTLFVAAGVLASVRSIRGEWRPKVLLPAWHALCAHLTAAGLLWILTYSLIGLRVLPRSVNVPGLPDAPTPCIEVLFAQVVPLMAASLMIAIIRGKYRASTGIIAGLLLLAINVITIRTGFMTGKLFLVTYLALHPLVAALPQVGWPSREKRKGD